MTLLPLEDVQAQLPELLDRAGGGEQIVIMVGGRPVGMLGPLPDGVPIIGRGKGTLIAWEDDDEHLKDFAEYMP